MGDIHKALDSPVWGFFVFGGFMQNSVEPRNVRDQERFVEYDIEDILSQIDDFAKGDD